MTSKSLYPANSRWTTDQHTLTPQAQIAFAELVRLIGGTNNSLPPALVYFPAGGSPKAFVYSDASGAITTTLPATNGQLLIGSTGNIPAIGSLTGTVNQITVTNGVGTITLSTPQDIDAAAIPTFLGLMLTGLNVDSFLYSGASGLLTSTAAPTNGQILVGSTGVAPTKTSITGTANQITVTNGPGSITLSLPQNIALGSSPTFAALTLSGLTANSFIYSGTASLVSSTAAPTNGQLLIGSTGAAPVKAGLTGTANQIVVTNGAGSITLSTPQDIGTTSTPTFDALTLTNGFGCNGKTPQTEVTVNGAVAGTAGVVYTVTEQTIINDLVALVNQLRAALVANGITV